MIVVGNDIPHDCGVCERLLEMLSVDCRAAIWNFETIVPIARLSFTSAVLSQSLSRW